MLITLSRISGPPSSFSSFIFCFCQLFQSLFNILAEFYFAFQDTARPARNATRIQLHAVLAIESEIFTGKGHGSAWSTFL